MRILVRWIIPILLLAVALCAAAGAAFGTQAEWAHRPHGVQFICAAHRFHVPLLALSIIASLFLIGGAMARKFALWWLLGLGLVLLVLAGRYARPVKSMALVDLPPVVDLLNVRDISETQDVAAFTFADRPCAIAIDALSSTAGVYVQDRDQRLLILFSPGCQRVIICPVDRELKLRDLQYVSSPLGTPLIYDRRLGQFIVAITGKTPEGNKPVGLHSPIETHRVTFGQWKRLHPDSLWIALASRQSTTTSPTRKFAVVATTQPFAVPSADIDALPANVSTEKLAVVLTRDPATGILRAFDRQIEEDLRPKFIRNIDPKRPTVWMIEEDTNTGYSLGGVGIDGPHKGAKLRSLSVDEVTSVDELGYWIKDLQTIADSKITRGIPVPEKPDKPAPNRRRNPPRNRPAN